MKPRDLLPVAAVAAVLVLILLSPVVSIARDLSATVKSAENRVLPPHESKVVCVKIAWSPRCVGSAISIQTVN